MTEIFTTVEAIEANLVAPEERELQFMGDAAFEFVGGGNAATCY